LRLTATSDLDSEQRLAEANRALHLAGVYAVREQLLVSASADLVAAGEAAFLLLVAVRDAIRIGSTLPSPGYHAVYHPFA
jgi:hypothetical protein